VRPRSQWNGDAIDYLRMLNASATDLFLYYVPGGTHAPHQPTPESIDKIHNMHLSDKADIADIAVRHSRDDFSRLEFA
jgi:hypothetical protein